MLSQEKRILGDLLHGRKITPLMALEKYGSFRLGARIYQLKRRGYEIHTEIVERNGKRFAQYSLDKKHLVGER